KGALLKYYSNQFNSIELNSTYYGIPEVQRIKKWCDSVPYDFTFCPKFPQSISGALDFNTPDNSLFKFIDILYAFEEKLGVSFFQFPTKMNPEIILNTLYDIL